jgi:hypothetical protein
MNCLECALQDRATPAVGLCHDCGAGVCLDHAAISERQLTRIMTIALEVAVEPPARMVRCGKCSAAVNAVQAESLSRPLLRSRHRSKKSNH